MEDARDAVEENEAETQARIETPAKVEVRSEPAAGTADGAESVTSEVEASKSGGAEGATAEGENPEGEEGSKKGGCLAQATKYFGVSFTQTFVEFGVFAALHGLGMNASIANVFAIACSGSYNFIMNRNITFKSSSNLTRSIILFILLYCWNLLFSSTCLAILPEAFGWNTTLVKLLTMCCQGVWGFLLSRYVIFR